ncbi:MAG: molecular chaperone [Pseudomonadales bacterium]|nr:molecular chaperone [Pseudomonadales bacterium]
MIGIDWGTSSSSVAHVDANGARLLPLTQEGGERLPSTAFVPRTPAHGSPTDEIGRARVLTPELLRRGALQFGDVATAAMLEGDDGFYVKSPKSFLGAELRDVQVANFTALVTRMLGHLVDRAGESLGERPRSAVVGRPVRYHGTRGEAGNAQALEIMTAAAREAGLEEVSFLLEPVAAAYAYELLLDRERLVLVVDAGGGTTDLTLVRLGPERTARAGRDDDVLGTAGDRIGGTDLDARLAFRAFTPALGRESLLDSGRPVPNHYYVDLCTVADVNAQTRFGAEATAEALADYAARAREPQRLERLLRLQETGGSFRFNRTAERTKIDLSAAERAEADLAWLEPGLALEAARPDLAWAASPLLEKIGELAAEVTRQAGARPDVVFVTGGTALSPVVADGLRAQLGEIELVVGDLFGSVAAGLGLAASRTRS